MSVLVRSRHQTDLRSILHLIGTLVCVITLLLTFAVQATAAGEAHRFVRARVRRAAELALRPIVVGTSRRTGCSLFGSSSISPCNEVISKARGSQTRSFTITNGNGSLTSFGVTASCSGAVTGCSISPASSSIAAHGTHIFTATFTIGSGTGHLVIDYESGLDDQGETDNVYTTIVQTVAVTPKAQAVNALALTPSKQIFSVKNTGVAAESYTFSALCSGSVTGCTVNPGSASIASGASTTDTVSFTPGAIGTTAIIKSVAKDASFTTPADTGSVNETAINNVLSARPPVVDVASVNAGTTVDKNLCLTIAAGPNAASECGALRIVHPLRSVRTLNKVRTPTLIYSSAQAQPLPIVDVNISLDASTAVPDTIVAVLKGSAGQGLDSVRIAGSAWALPQTTRRVALRYSALASATDLYKYSVDVRNIYNGSSVQTATATSQLIVVNRSTSEFGAGWWLAGLERLYLNRTDTILWVGGDGSARVYTRKTSTVFSAPNVDHPDSIVKVGTNYIRYLPEKLQVRFDGTTGYHTATINRLGHTTLFAYTGGTTGLLQSITVPPGNAKKYTFSYTVGNKLDTISNPGPGPQSAERRRRTRAVVTGTQLLSLRDCDAGLDCSTTDIAGVINFTYATGTNLIKSRTDRLGTLRSYFYDSLYQMSRDSVALDASHTIVTQYRNADSLARPTTLTATAIPIDSAYVRIDGPRPLPTQDYSSFWLDRFGAPRRIHNAVGDSTVVTADAVWPGLVARVRRSSGQVLKAWYNSRALMDSSTDSTHYSDVTGTRRFATTRVVWEPSYEGATKITLPEGEETHFSYDAVTGNRLTQYQGLGLDTTHIVHYGYNASGLLTSMQTPLVTRPQHFVYDPTLQNLDTIKTPRGYPTTYSYDSLGRIASIESPIDSIQSLVGGNWLTQSTLYDGMDRDTLATTISPAVSYPLYGARTAVAPAQTLQVHKLLDNNGRVNQLIRTASDVTLPLVETWAYDAVNRTRSISYPNGSVEHYGYDESGDVIADTSRRGDIVKATYDAMNRLTMKIIPALSPAGFTAEGKTFPHYPGETFNTDTLTFAYDSGGTMTMANNFNAHITRQYNPDGSISLDSMAMTSFFHSSWTLHNYALRYRYDLNGRRSWFRVPTQLAPRTTGGQPQDTMTYRYDSATGQVSRVYDVQNAQFYYYYDREGRLNETVAPNGIATDYRYDDAGDGQLKTVFAASHYYCQPLAPGYALVDPGFIFTDSLVRDGRGKVVEFTQPDSTPASWHRGRLYRTSYRYSGLGTLIYEDENDVDESTPTTCLGAGTGDPIIVNPYSEWASDAFGNNLSSQVQHFTLAGGDPATSNSHYNPTTLQLAKTTATGGTSHLDSFADTAMYDQVGNRTYLHRYNLFSNLNHWEASYFNGAGKLYAVDRQSDNNVDYWKAGAHFDYKYDALGRRLQSYTIFDPACTNAACRATVQRSIWDGDRLLAETRYPADSGQYWDADTGLVVNSGHTDYGHFGRVLYTHGVALDEPIGLFRLSYGPGAFFNTPIRITPHWNWRGVAVTGTFSDGNRYHCNGGYVTQADTTCVDVGWSGDWSAFLRSRTAWTNGAGVAPAWEGNLIRQNADNSEQLYKRNRYYDPVQGRFTQEDPIGLAGGINSYGFAAGDPVNFSDPFGLMIDMSALNKDQQKSISNLRKSSKTFDKWFKIIDNIPADVYTLRIFTAGGRNIKFVQDNGDGFTLNARPNGTMLFSSTQNRSNSMEFESVVAHEFAHAAAGLEGGTDAVCANSDVGPMEACAVTAQNKVHEEIGMRDRRDHEDLGPFKSPP